eukprot:TRINITY_DN3219_c0_g2_i1.p1 TRINITY_DN3219_c0_g2~~TRINITY_DN3219_c0_g2_i1.p1  ORF type:complete len:331 (+),score=83.53 TRINITY_DN3219_c0_g2_i1:71-1063(+)
MSVEYSRLPKQVKLSMGAEVIKLGISKTGYFAYSINSKGILTLIELDLLEKRGEFEKDSVQLAKLRPNSNRDKFMVQCHPDAPFVAVCWDNVINFYDLLHANSRSRFENVIQLPSNLTITCFSFLPIGNQMLVGAHNGTLHLFDLQTFAFEDTLGTAAIPNYQDYPITHIVFDFDYFAVGHRDNRVTIWNASCGEYLFVINFQKPVENIFFGEGGNCLYIAGKQEIRRYDIYKSGPVEKRTYHNNGQEFKYAQCIENRTIIVAANESNLLFWDVNANGEPFNQLLTGFTKNSDLVSCDNYEGGDTLLFVAGFQGGSGAAPSFFKRVTQEE